MPTPGILSGPLPQPLTRAPRRSSGPSKVEKASSDRHAGASRAGSQLVGSRRPGRRDLTAGRGRVAAQPRLTATPSLGNPDRRLSPLVLLGRCVCGLTLRPSLN
jgi:hypothetical protein